MVQGHIYAKIYLNFLEANALVGSGSEDEGDFRNKSYKRKFSPSLSSTSHRRAVKTLPALVPEAKATAVPGTEAIAKNSACLLYLPLTGWKAIPEAKATVVPGTDATAEIQLVSSTTHRRAGRP
jgi:hypothetical protein